MGFYSRKSLRKRILNLQRDLSEAKEKSLGYGRSIAHLLDLQDRDAAKYAALVKKYDELKRQYVTDRLLAKVAEGLSKRSVNDAGTRKNSVSCLRDD